MRIRHWHYLITGLLILGFTGIWTFKKFNFNTKFSVGQPIDSLNGIVVYYNGGVDNVAERNTTTDGYNLGLKYQCIEFVKRYYYEYLGHKMPDSYGHAKDFYDKMVPDGEINTKRNLVQFTNPSSARPTVSDLLIFDGSLLNKYGHVAIVSHVEDNLIEIIQQNPGPFGKSRESYILDNRGGKWKINNSKILGWLRKDSAGSDSSSLNFIK